MVKNSSEVVRKKQNWFKYAEKRLKLYKNGHNGGKLVKKRPIISFLQSKLHSRRQLLKSEAGLNILF
jgi:hypothetical protein